MRSEIIESWQIKQEKMAISFPLCRSDVFHNGKCFFVSTIDRQSSATDGPRRFSETFVFECDEKNESTGNVIFQDGGNSMSLSKHFLIVDNLFTHGRCDIQEDDDL